MRFSSSGGLGRANLPVWYLESDRLCLWAKGIGSKKLDRIGGPFLCSRDNLTWGVDGSEFGVDPGDGNDMSMLAGATSCM